MSRRNRQVWAWLSLMLAINFASFAMSEYLRSPAGLKAALLYSGTVLSVLVVAAAIAEVINGDQR